jgi:glutamyl-tRNA reductase
VAKFEIHKYLLLPFCVLYTVSEQNLLTISLSISTTKFSKIAFKMSLPYKHILVVGATSGIGRSMADKLVESGYKVTAVGRRQNRLDEFVKQHGSENASAVAFDMSEMEKAPQFAAE